VAADEVSRIVDAIPGLAWSCAPNGDFDYFNQRWCDYSGMSMADACNGGWRDAIHPDDFERVLEWGLERRRTGQAGEVEARLRRSDGEYRWFLIRTEGQLDDTETRPRWFGQQTDIDDRKRAEAALRRSEAFLAQAQNLSSIGSFLWKVPSNELHWSEEVYRIYGFREALPITMELALSRTHPEDIALTSEIMDRARLERHDFSFEYRLKFRDGSVKYLHVVGRATHSEDGQLEYLGAIQDVTERRRSEEALGKVRSELAHVTRVMSLGALTASIAHEVNQPLAGIITNASTCLRMLAADPPNVEGALETARRTIRDGNRASDVIVRLRQLFAKTDAATDSVDLNEATREVITLSQSELQRSGVILRTELADDLPPVTGDRVQLQQVILNLLLNASDAMNGIDCRPKRLLVTTGRDGDDGVRLSVQDSGVGINPEEVNKLFDAFYTTKSGGMGIGLSVSSSIIESHRGRLWAASNDGPGATFSFSLPAAGTRSR
jgi:hypothetical protein